LPLRLTGPHQVDRRREPPDRPTDERLRDVFVARVPGLLVARDIAAERWARPHNADERMTRDRTSERVRFSPVDLLASTPLARLEQRLPSVRGKATETPCSGEACPSASERVMERATARSGLRAAVAPPRCRAHEAGGTCHPRCGRRCRQPPLDSRTCRYRNNRAATLTAQASRSPLTEECLLPLLRHRAGIASARRREGAARASTGGPSAPRAPWRPRQASAGARRAPRCSSGRQGQRWPGRRRRPRRGRRPAR